MATPEPAVGLDEAEEQESASPPQPAGVEEVEGFEGTMESAIEAGLLARPRVPLTWKRWQIWRSATATRPAANLPGGRGSRAEAALWRRIMTFCHGPTWIKDAKHVSEDEWQEFLASSAVSLEHLNEARDSEAYRILASRRQATEGESLRALGAQDRADLLRRWKM